MNTLLILSAQAVAVFEISALLLVAAIIGFVTSWYYFKSINLTKTKLTELDLINCKNQLLEITNDKNELQKNIIEKISEIEQLNVKINSLKTLNTQSFIHVDNMNYKNKLNNNNLQNNIPQSMHLLKGNNYGPNTLAKPDNLKMISGIGPFIEERLHDLDINTFIQISNFTANDISKIDSAIEYFAGRIDRDNWVDQARELVIDKQKQNELLQRIKDKKNLIYYSRIGTANKTEANDLTQISGIGGWISEKLNALDIYTFRQISNFNDDDIEIVTNAIEYFPGRIKRDEWIQQANKLLQISISKLEYLEQISVMKNRIYYDRLGIEHKHHANNLTLIKGISLWIEECLNMLEIYSFKQISKLTADDIVIISDIIKIAPNRINQDCWVEQANELVNAN